MQGGYVCVLVHSTVHSAWFAQYSYEYCAHHAVLVRVLRAPCSTVAVQLLVPPPAVEIVLGKSLGTSENSHPS